ncbi:MAG: FGGY-family carbohydrate kinase [Janthinobacterium lividum]
MRASGEIRTVAVLDVGKTNVKLVLVDVAEGREVWSRSMGNSVRQDGPYPHADVEAIAAFLNDGLAAVARDIDALSITTHGATGALLRGDGLALPVLDYEHAGPDALAEAYDRVRPGFAETFSPRLRGGLNLGAQLFWQAHAFPQVFAIADAFVTYPQYWAWRLTGVAATEATSLGCHTDLWAPGRDRVSSLVETQGWTGHLAPLRSAFDRIGPLRPELAARLGLRPGLPVACGIHDSNASLLPHLQRGSAPATIVSSGTWVISFAIGGSLDSLDPCRDTLANVDAYRRPVPSARFMGGREFDLLTGGAPVEPDAATVGMVIARCIMALPTFVAGCGSFPDRVGGWSVDPAPLTAPERTAVASLYAALMTAAGLNLIGATGATVIEGPLAANRLYGEALLALTGRPVAVAGGGTGTSIGAASLVAPVATPHPSPVVPRFGLGEAFAAYTARWRASVAH